MAKQRTLFVFCVLFFVFMATSICQEVEDAEEFSYVPGSENGPDKWGDIRSEWSECKTGEMQSPIDLRNDSVTVGRHLERLRRNYKPTNTTIRNRGHDILLRWVGGGGTIQINDTEYELQQCHWHAPSEHTIDGKKFALELHMVHESTDGRVAVVGIMYTIGRPDTFFEELMEHIGSVVTTDEDVERDTGVLDPRHMKMGSRKYYRYIGSLTIPPCTENVVRTIIRKVRTVSREQLRLRREAVQDETKTNARPVQPLNDRIVQQYRPKKP